MSFSDSPEGGRPDSSPRPQLGGPRGSVHDDTAPPASPPAYVPAWRRHLARRVVALGLLAVTLYLLGPSVARTLSSWPSLKHVDPLWLVGVAAAQAASTASLAWLQLIAMRTRAWFAVTTAELAGGAVSRAVPAGTAAAAAVQYTMLTGAGVPAAAVASGLTVASLLTLATIFALPLVSLPVILGSTPVPRGLAEAAYIGLGVFALMVAAGLIVLRTDRPLHAFGRAAQALVNRLRRKGPRMTDLPDRLLAERDAVRAVLGTRAIEAVVASVGRWAFDYLSLLAALEAVGARPDPWLVLLAFCASQMLAAIPLTPGGLGFVEAGLTATLALAGVSASQAVVATLVYRLFSYWLPMPVGVVAWWLYHRRYSPARA
jgi:uncharacterized protein (TIRG00374 family)